MPGSNKQFFVILAIMSILFYKRPDYIAKPEGPLDLSQCQKYVDRTKSCRSEIPPELSFENVLADKAMPVRSCLLNGTTSS